MLPFPSSNVNKPGWKQFVVMIQITPKPTQLLNFTQNLAVKASHFPSESVSDLVNSWDGAAELQGNLDMDFQDY